MKPGDLAEIAIWLSGTETPEQIERWKTVDAPAALQDAERQHNVEVGPVTWTTKAPGEDRVPPVPDHINGPDVRLLIGEAKVRGKPLITRESGFVHDLTKDDLAKLRRMTRRAHRSMHPGDRLTDARCDAVIEALGPDVAVKTLRDGAAVN